NTLDFEAFDDAFLVARRFDVVTELAAMARHLVLVDFARVADGLEDFTGVQGQPPLAVGIPGGVCDDEVGVKLRIQSPGGVVPEGGGADVRADLGLPGRAGAIGGKAFELGEGRGGRPVVSGVQALVLESDCHDGDALLSRALEVEEADSILRSSRCQPTGAVRQEVPAQGLKGGIVLGDGVSGETQPLRPLPHPDAGDQLVFAVVVVGGQISRVKTVRRDARLGPIPQTKKEVATLGSLYGASRSELFVGDGAT